MKKAAFLMAFVFMFQFFASSACALVSVPQQEQVSVVVEEGRSLDFVLALWNDKLSSSQDVVVAANSPWITFDGGDSYVIDYVAGGGFAFVPVTVSVPEGTTMGEYTAQIKSGSSVLSSVNIRTIMSMQDIELLQETSNMDQEIDELEARLQEVTEQLGEKIDLNREDLVRQIMEMYDYNVELSDLITSKSEMEDKVSVLQQEVQDLEKKKQENEALTGMVSAGTSLNLVLGFLAGGAIVFLLLRRKKVSVFIGNILYPSKYKRKKWKD